MFDQRLDCCKSRTSVFIVSSGIFCSMITVKMVKLIFYVSICIGLLYRYTPRCGAVVYVAQFFSRNYNYEYLFNRC